MIRENKKAVWGVVGSFMVVALIAATTMIDYNTQIKNRPVFSVKDAPFLARGDGTTDDTTAIRAAVTAAALTSAEILFPPGNYKVTGPITVTGNLSIRATGFATITTTGAFTLFDQNGALLELDGMTFRQSDTVAMQYFHLHKSTGQPTARLSRNTFISRSTTAVSMLLMDDLINSYFRDNFIGGPCQACSDVAGPTTTRTPIGLELNSPVTGTTTVYFMGNYITGWKYGLQVTGGNGLSLTDMNIFENNWIGIHGVYGTQGSFGWEIGATWCENNKFTTFGCGFFGDPADQANLTTAPRLVNISGNVSYETDNDNFGGPKIQKTFNYTSPTAGTTDFNFVSQFPNALAASWVFQRKVSSALEMVKVDCAAPVVAIPCKVLFDSTTSVPAGQASKFWFQQRTIDTTSAVWWHEIRAEGNVMSIESVDTPGAATDWKLIHFPNSSHTDTTIGANVVAPGDIVSSNASGTMRTGAGTAGMPGGAVGTTSANRVDMLYNSGSVGFWDASGLHLGVNSGAGAGANKVVCWKADGVTPGYATVGEITVGTCH